MIVFACRCCCKCYRSKDDSHDKSGVSTTIVIENPIQNIGGSSYPREHPHVYDALMRDVSPGPKPNQTIPQTDSKVYDQVYDYVDQQRGKESRIDQNRPAHPLPDSVKTDGDQIQGRAYLELVSESDQQYDDTAASSTIPTYPKQVSGPCIQNNDSTRSGDDRAQYQSYLEPINKTLPDNNENYKTKVIENEPVLKSSPDKQEVYCEDDGYLKPAPTEKQYYVNTTDDTVENGYSTLQRSEHTTDIHTYTQLH